MMFNNYNTSNQNDMGSRQFEGSRQVHTWDSEPVTIALQALLLVERRSPVKFLYFVWGTNRVCECKMYVEYTCEVAVKSR